MGRKSCVVSQNRARFKRLPVRVLPGDEESKQQQKKKKGNKEPAASHHRGSASVPSATHRAHAMRAEAPPPSLVGSRRSPATRSAVRVCGHSLFKTTKVKPHKGGFKNRLFPLLRSPLLSLSAFVSASHFVCSCRVSVINLHQIKSSEELAKAVKRGPHSSQALDKAFGGLRRGSATRPL